MVVWENPSRSVGWEIVRPARLPPTTIFILFKSVQFLFHSDCQYRSQLVIPTMDAQVAVMWLAEDQFAFTSSWTFYWEKGPVVFTQSSHQRNRHLLFFFFFFFFQIYHFLPTTARGVKITKQNNLALANLAATVKHSGVKRLWILSVELQA